MGSLAGIIGVGTAIAHETAALPGFAEVVETHKAMVYSIAWQFVRDRATAEELAQDVFVELHRNWRSMQSAQHIVNWLRRVASHRAIDCVRKHRVRPETSLTPAHEPATTEKPVDSLLSAHLERIVASLPPKQRIVIVLRYQEGMELQEIAHTLGIRVTTVKTRIFRALELLRSKTAQSLGRKVE